MFTSLIAGETVYIPAIFGNLGKSMSSLSQGQQSRLLKWHDDIFEVELFLFYV